MTSSSSNIIIREGRSEDAAIISEYNRQMALETESKILDPQILKNGVTRGLNQPDLCRYFVALVEVQVVGQAMITFEWSDWRDGELWWLQSVYVHPEYRRRGIFRHLFSHIEQLARKSDQVRGLRLYVEEDNSAGMDVYRRLGMEHAGYHVFEREF
jgi:GNAT superfamily N-acetyltransferase